MIKKLLITTAFASFCFGASAAPIAKNTAKFQAMNKITGTVSKLEIPVNGQAKYEDFSIVLRQCKTNPPEETPENYAFVDIAETNQDQEEKNIYKGWMLSSSPALNPLEHPMYDLWLLECVDEQQDSQMIMSQEELDKRDNLETAQESNDDSQSREILESYQNKTEEPKTSEPESLIDLVDTQVQFNAIEEEKKQKELEEAKKEVEEEVKEDVSQAQEVIKEEVTEVIPQAINKEEVTDKVLPKQEIEEIKQEAAQAQEAIKQEVNEVKEEVKENTPPPSALQPVTTQEKSQLIDFSSFID